MDHHFWIGFGAAIAFFALCALVGLMGAFLIGPN